MDRRYISRDLFKKFAGRTRLRNTALTAARMVLVRHQSIMDVAREMRIQQPLVSRAVKRIMIEANKSDLLKIIIAGFPRKKAPGGITSPVTHNETIFENIVKEMGPHTTLNFVLDIKLRENTKNGNTLGLLRLSPEFAGDNLAARDLLLKRSRTIVNEILLDKDILIRIDNDFFVITENIHLDVPEILIARYRDKFQKRLDLKIDVGLSLFNPNSVSLSASKMIAQAR